MALEMFPAMMPDRTEMIQEYCYLYGTSETEAAAIVDRALEAAEAEAEFRRPLLGWLLKLVYADVITDGVSLRETAAEICPDNPDVPMACYLSFLQRCHGMTGILSFAAHVCDVEESIYRRLEEPKHFFRTGEKSWLLEAVGTGKLITVELWRVFEQYPQLLKEALSTEGEENCLNSEVENNG